MSSILRLPAVMARTGLCRTSIYNGARDGWFPKPVQLTKRAIGWRADAIDAWIAERSEVGVSAGVSGERDSHAA